jgi:hypothetical protein
MSNRVPKQLKTCLATAVVLTLAAPAHAQPETPPATDAQPAAEQPATPPPAPEDEVYDETNGEEIVVTGVRRGAVIGDIPPENQLGPRDVRATGATDITELLDALAPQIGSARGRGGERPILLLNGQRISSFREMRDIPTEAIERVEILPEEVALRYGYRADQRVVNIVLRQRFRSTTTRVEGSTATAGGYLGGTADLTQLRIDRNGRTTLNLRAEGNTPVTEAERNILLADPAALDERFARTLVGSKRLVRGGATINRTVLGDVGATLNAELEHNDGRSLFGLSEVALEPLVRNSETDTAHVGLVLNGSRGRWRWSLTGNGDLTRTLTRSDREDQTRSDRAKTNTISGDVDLMGNGPLFALPAGDANLTVRAGASTLHLDGIRRRAGVSTSNDLGRTRGSASANLDLPISRRNRDFAALGNLTLNANAEVEQYSDFGTLTTIGAGLNWSPLDRLNLLTSWTREEGAPTVQQLGDPTLETPGTRVFDFTRGETVLVTSITGGNPELLADRRNVLKIGGNWKPFDKTDLRLRGEYARSRLKSPVSTFPGPSAELEAAFPDRFVRDASGQLISVDFRPVNFDQARRDTIRWGFDFSKPLKSAPPSAAAIAQFRARRAAQSGQSEQRAADAGEQPRDRARSSAGDRAAFGAGAGPGGFGGFGRFRGGGQGGRLQFSLTHTINLLDEVIVAPGTAKIDYLQGAAVGQFGGRPRHEVEAQAGWSNNGLGARLSANWRSGTHVSSENGDDLHFSPLATFDLRLFANLGERFDLVAKRPWLRGTQLRLEVNNLFDSKPRVRNAAGEVPFTYQSDLLDPLGRTIAISIRKLFLPPRSFFRRPDGEQQR